jgi:hypothetical protein
MMNKLRFTALVIFAIALFCAPALSQTTSEKTQDAKYWALSQKYCNARFGFCVRYPASLVMRDAPANDDGRNFDNGNGLYLTVSGINNAANDIPKTEMSSARKQFDRVTYRAVGKNWFVLSGLKNDEIIYLKTFIGSGSVNHLEIKYGVKFKTFYRTVGGNIAQSFKPGQLGVPH